MNDINLFSEDFHNSTLKNCTIHRINTQINHTFSLYSIVWSPDGRYLYSSSWDNTIRTWDGETLTLTKIFTGLIGPVESIDIFFPKNLLVSGSDDKTIKLWNLTTGEMIVSVEAHNDSIYKVIFSPDGSHIASCSKDNTIQIW